MLLKRLNPSVSRNWLFLLAGGMWTAVGIMLLWRAVGWLMAMTPNWEISLGLAGLILGILAYRFGFIHTARKNIERLCSLPDSVCIFAFNSVKGYAIIAAMITLGITLRHSSLPRSYLAILYTTMGGALFLASLHFYRHLWQLTTAQEPCQSQEDASGS